MELLPNFNYRSHVFSDERFVLAYTLNIQEDVHHRLLN